MTEPSLDAFVEFARGAGLTLTTEEAPRMHEAWQKLRSVLLARLPAAPDLADEPALVFVPTGAGVKR